MLTTSRSGKLTDGLSGAATTSTTAGLYTVLLKVRVVSVAGAGVEVGFGIVVRALIFVLDKKTDGSSKSDAMLSARLKLDEILFVPLARGFSDACGCWGNGSYRGSKITLSRTAAAELHLDFSGAKFEALRTDLSRRVG